MIHKTAGELSAADLNQWVTVAQPSRRRSGPLAAVWHDGRSWRILSRLAFQLAPNEDPTADWWPHDTPCTVETPEEHYAAAGRETFGVGYVDEQETLL